MESNWAQTDNAKYLEIKKKVEEKTTKENPLYRQQLVNAVVNFCNEAGPLLDTRNYALTTYMQGSELKERTLKDVDEKLGNLVRVYEDKAESAYTAYIDRLYAAYRIKIDQVNNAGMAFLQVASLSQDEFDDLVVQYAGNHTMEAALKGYAEKNELECFPFLEKEDKADIAHEAAKYALSVIRNGHNNYEINSYAAGAGMDLFKNLRVCIE